MIIDTNSSCAGKTKQLKDMNVDVVGRYYRMQTHPEWRVTRAEAVELTQAGIMLFTVFEDFGKASKLKLTREQGGKDGQSAHEQAEAIGQPKQSTIYFAVEGLPGGYGKSDLPGIREYFKGVTDALGGDYKAGVYGDGLVCKTLLDEGTCAHTWLAAASHSFPGTKDFTRSWRWSIAQMGPLDINANGLSVDLDVAKDEFGAFFVT